MTLNKKMLAGSRFLYLMTLLMTGNSFDERFSESTQLTFTCSKSTIEALEKAMEYVQI